MGHVSRGVSDGSCGGGLCEVSRVSGTVRWVV